MADGYRLGPIPNQCFHPRSHRVVYPSTDHVVKAPKLLGLSDQRTDQPSKQTTNQPSNQTIKQATKQANNWYSWQVL